MGGNQYRRFARVYDYFMDETPYAVWADYIDRALKARLPGGNAAPLVLDAACGTGGMTVLLAEKGYDMTGVDISADMLAEAREKAAKRKLNILFLQQDMRGLDLYGTMDAAVCVCDGLNYLLEASELETAFKKIAKFLNPGGVFIFDMNTEYKFKNVLGGRVFTWSRRDASYVWKNTYDDGARINTYELTFTIHKRMPRGGQGEVFKETHRQRAYPVETISELLSRAGFRFSVNRAYTDAPYQAECERLSYIAIKSE